MPWVRTGPVKTLRMIWNDETIIRLAVFAGIFVTMAAWEILAPRRKLAVRWTRRWVTNLSLIGVDALAVRVVLPIVAVGVAAWSEHQGIGLFALVDLPFWLELAVAVALLDLAIYLQHLATHKIPVLWRLHRVHHADRDIDVTTGLRFHPIEMVLSMVWKFAVIVAIGASPMAVFVFEVLLNGLAMFNHANVRIPAAADRVLRLAVVTPDMHRVHHSVRLEETDSNYGFNLSLWDRLFGTYRPQPRDGHEAMRIGLLDCLDDRPTRLGWSLLSPFTDHVRRRISKERAEST